MNSLCAGSCSSHVPFAAPSPRLSPHQTQQSSSIKLNKNNIPDDLKLISASSSSSASCNRREVLGLGLGLGLGSFFSPTDPAVAECEFSETPSGLAFCDKLLGTGPQPQKGQLIKAHYTGKLLDGTVFDSSYNRGKPLSFRVGVGEVIKGWDQGILGGDGIPPMSAGGKRTLKIPPELAYGVRGAGCRGGTCIIPPNSVLLFDVEFVGKA